MPPLYKKNDLGFERYLLMTMVLANSFSFLCAQGVLIDKQYCIDSVRVSYLLPSLVAYPTSMCCWDWNLDKESDESYCGFSITNRDTLKKLINYIGGADTCNAHLLNPWRKIFFFSKGRCTFSICVGKGIFISGGECYSYDSSLRNLIETRIKALHPECELEYDTNVSIVKSKSTAYYDDCLTTLCSLEILSFGTSLWDSLLRTHYVLASPQHLFDLCYSANGKMKEVYDNNIIDDLRSRLNAMHQKEPVTNALTQMMKAKTKPTSPSVIDIPVYKLIFRYENNLVINVYVGKTFVIIENDYYELPDGLINSLEKITYSCE